MSGENTSEKSKMLNSFAIIVIVAIISLISLAIAYWLIMKQDATALTTVSASIGTIIGYYFKALTEKLRRGGE